MDELRYGLSNIFIYFVVAVVIVLTIRALIRMQDELFRKLLHFVLLGSLVVWTVSFHTWWIEALTVVAFVIVVYPILMFFERFRAYSEVVTERKRGELKSSLIVVFLMFAIVIAVTEGIFGDEYLTIASIFAWGIGDAFAALVGKKFGRHKLKGKFLTGKKSLEGTLAMFLISFLSVMVVLLLRGGARPGGNPVELVITSLCTGAVSAVCELYTKDGMDTITCPLASMAVMLGLLAMFGGL